MTLALPYTRTLSPSPSISHAAYLFALRNLTVSPCIPARVCRTQPPLRHAITLPTHYTTRTLTHTHHTPPHTLSPLVPTRVAHGSASGSLPPTPDGRTVQPLVPHAPHLHCRALPLHTYLMPRTVGCGQCATKHTHNTAASPSTFGSWRNRTGKKKRMAPSWRAHCAVPLFLIFTAYHALATMLTHSRLPYLILPSAPCHCRHYALRLFFLRSMAPCLPRFLRCTPAPRRRLTCTRRQTREQTAYL